MIYVAVFTIVDGDHLRWLFVTDTGNVEAAVSRDGMEHLEVVASFGTPARAIRWALGSAGWLTEVLEA